MTKTKTPEVTISEATFSECGRYRYTLRRAWDAGPSHSGTVCWVMRNPSTADADKLDPTLRRCRGFTLGWGFAAMSVVNLYALRSTDPRGLWDTSDPVGPDNDEAIRRGDDPRGPRRRRLGSKCEAGTGGLRLVRHAGQAWRPRRSPWSHEGRATAPPALPPGRLGAACLHRPGPDRGRPMSRPRHGRCIECGVFVPDSRTDKSEPGGEYPHEHEDNSLCEQHGGPALTSEAGSSSGLPGRLGRRPRLRGGPSSPRVRPGAQASSPPGGGVGEGVRRRRRGRRLLLGIRPHRGRRHGKTVPRVVRGRGPA